MLHRASDGIERDVSMGRTREEIMAGLPKARRARIEARAKELVGEIEGLKALREIAARSQEQTAQALGVKHPSVLKMERQADLYLSTPRRFVEAAGGSWNRASNCRARGGAPPYGDGGYCAGKRDQAVGDSAGSRGG